MSQPKEVPADLFVPGDFVGSLDPDDLVYFVCNVGDGDSQLLLLPESEGRRSAIVVDSASKDKIPWLLRNLEAKWLIHPEDELPIALIVATHPHLDHIRGIPYLLEQWGDRAREFWDSGYFHPSGAYHNMMTALEKNQGRILYAQPTSGLKRWIGSIAITVLSPSIHLRNRYDTYGVHPNNASISLRVEYPAARVVQEKTGGRSYWSRGASGALMLGADCQTLSWSYVLTDFPRLEKSHSTAARAIGLTTGNVDLLQGQVLKASHHGSKRGLNLELIERIKPAFTLLSTVGQEGSHKFPHSLAQEIIREAVDPIAKTGAPRKPDWLLGIFYTCDVDSAGQRLGSIAVVLRGRRRPRMWRFGDGSGQPLQFNQARADIRDLLVDTFKRKRAAATIARYQKLQVGSGGHGFLDFILANVAERVAGQDPKGAIRLLRFNARSYPKSGHTSFTMAQIYRAMNDLDGAIRALKRALKAEPGNESYRRALRKAKADR